MRITPRPTYISLAAWKNPISIQEITLGETLTLGVSATDTDGQVVAIQLVIDGDKENPLSSIDISDPELKPGAFQYIGSDPQFLLHYLPSALGKLELQVVAVDDEGKITYSDPITYEVTNGDPPVVEMVGPQMIRHMP